MASWHLYLPLRRLRTLRRDFHVPAILPKPSVETHDVFNQAEPWFGNTFDADAAVQVAVSDTSLADRDWLSGVGAWAGSSTTAALSHAANSRPPTFSSHDNVGRRVGVVTYDESYHALLSHVVTSAVPSRAWNATLVADRNRSNVGQHAHRVRGAGGLLAYQGDAGVGCPATMTYACVPTLVSYGGAAYADIVTRVITPIYDRTHAPLNEKRGLTIGMSMTEKQVSRRHAHPIRRRVACTRPK